MTEEQLQFAMWLTGHDEETIKQMYNDWKCSPKPQERQCDCKQRGEPYNYDCPYAFETHNDNIVCTKGMKL